jgi:feruloyl-CoA synthase
LGALHAGVPYAPISPAYSLVGGAFERLRDVIGLLTPGLVYAGGPAFGAALEACVPAGTERATRSGGPGFTAFAEIEAADHPSAVAAAHGAVTRESIAKFLFTSGSTGLPKGVINTHGMLCANQAQIAATFPSLTAAPPVLVDWLPWHHTFGGNHNFNIVLFNGGTLYIDEGKPMPAWIAETVRNLREIAPTAYFTVPKGYEAIIPHLESDPVLRANFFSRLDMAFFAAAGLPQPVWDDFDRVAVAELGARVPMLTGLGSTETAPFCLVCSPAQSRSGHVGLPVYGVELKLAPVGDKLEARVKGPNVTPGYWRNPQLTAAAFDEEGYYRLGDALLFVDPDDPGQGLRFDGRLNEDFKLMSGVWASVGPLRARFLDAAAPYGRDIAVAGENRDEIAGLIVPDLDACRSLCPHLPADAGPGEILADPAVRGAFAGILAGLAREATGSSNRITRVILMAEPPSLDRNEMTDKGSVNQRTMLRNRAALVEALYADPPGPEVILPEQATI